MPLIFVIFFVVLFLMQTTQPLSVRSNEVSTPASALFLSNQQFRIWRYANYSALKVFAPICIRGLLDVLITNIVYVLYSSIILVGFGTPNNLLEPYTSLNLPLVGVVTPTVYPMTSV